MRRATALTALQFEASANGAADVSAEVAAAALKTRVLEQLAERQHLEAEMCEAASSLKAFAVQVSLWRGCFLLPLASPLRPHSHLFQSDVLT